MAGDWAAKPWRGLLLCACFLAVPLAGCLSETAALVVEAPQWEPGARWDYTFTYLGEATSRLHGTARQEIGANVTILAADTNVTVNGKPGTALWIDAGYKKSLNLPLEVLQPGLVVLDGFHEPVAGPAPGRDILCDPAVDVENVNPWPLRFPLVVDDRWEVTFRELVHAVTVVGWESVEVSAGRFDALRLDLQALDFPDARTGLQVTSTASVWYAPDVQNFVLFERIHESQEERYTDDRSTRTTVRFELVDYDLAASLHRSLEVRVVGQPALPLPALRIASSKASELNLGENTTTEFWLEHADSPAPRDEGAGNISDLGLEDTFVDWTINSERAGGAPTSSSIGFGPSTEYTFKGIGRWTVTAAVREVAPVQCVAPPTAPLAQIEAPISTYFDWNGSIEVPAGQAAEQRLVKLPAATGRAQAVVHWNLTSQPFDIETERGSPRASCDDCDALPATSGTATWRYAGASASDLWWKPDGSGFEQARGFHTFGHTAELSIRILPESLA